MNLEDKECALAEKVAAHTALVDKMRSEFNDVKGNALDHQKRKWQESMKRCMEQAVVERDEAITAAAEAHDLATKNTIDRLALELADERQKWAAEREGAVNASLRKAGKDRDKAVKDLEARKQGMFIKYFSLYSVYVQCNFFAKLTFYYYSRSSRAGGGVRAGTAAHGT